MLNENSAAVYKVMKLEAKQTVDNLKFDLDCILENLGVNGGATDLQNSRQDMIKLKSRLSNLAKVLDTLTAVSQFNED